MTCAFSRRADTLLRALLSSTGLSLALLRRLTPPSLSFSKLNIGLFTIQRTQIFNPIEMARGVVRMFSAEARQRGVKLTLAIDETIERLRATGLTADAHRLSQVLINYLTNALRCADAAADAS